MTPPRRLDSPSFADVANAVADSSSSFAGSTDASEAIRHENQPSLEVKW
jgi:hypothetical protein